MHPLKLRERPFFSFSFFLFLFLRVKRRAHPRRHCCSSGTASALCPWRRRSRGRSCGNPWSCVPVGTLHIAGRGCHPGLRTAPPASCRQSSWLLEFYTWATSNVISSRVQTCDSVYSWCPTGRSGHQHHDLISHSITLCWHWANQSFPYLNNVERLARKRQVSILNHWFDWLGRSRWCFCSII